MDADIVNSLINLDKMWRTFDYKGIQMTREQVKNTLVYGIQKGYKNISELMDEEIESIINNTSK